MPYNDTPSWNAAAQEAPARSNDVVVSVSNVNGAISALIKGDRRFNDLSVRGEISQFTENAKSGHWYFTIKDEQSVLRCALFTFQQRNVNFRPRVGMKVICRGVIDVYVPKGEYSLKCTTIIPDGEGAQAAALEELKKRLDAEGLFAQKRPIPTKPKKIAAVTSASGAAIKDIIDTLNEHYPLVKLVLVPTQVEGPTAPQQIANAMRRAADTGADTIIIGRGGGATDTLEAFNTEVVARAIYASPIPTISAVGHGINSTIADLVADHYAAAPSAAVMAAVPQIKMYIAGLDDTKRRLSINMQNKLAQYERNINAKAELVRALSPEARLNALEQRIDSLGASVKTGIHNRLSTAERGVNASAGVISALNPLAILARGYSVTESNGQILDSVEGLNSGDELKIRLADGTVTAQVKSIERNNNTNGI